MSKNKDFSKLFDVFQNKSIQLPYQVSGFRIITVRLIGATLAGAELCVRIADETSEAFGTQGDALSYLLFNIALEGAARRSGVQRNGDIDIIGIDRRAVEEASVLFKREAARIALTINTAKYLVAGRASNRAGDGISEVEIDRGKIRSSG